MNFGIDRADQHAALVAGADHADADRLGDRVAVAEVQRPRPLPEATSALIAFLQQVAADRLAADGGVEVFLADRSFFGS